MLQNFEIVLASVGILVTLVIAISACVCGCKNNNQKNELTGMPGVVKLNLDEEILPPNSSTPASDKRNAAQNNHRSLPEIPNAVTRHDSGDTASEIYATLNLDEGVEKGRIPGIREHPYEHAYAKLQNETEGRIEVIAEQASTSAESNENATSNAETEENDAPSEAVVISASAAISGGMPSSQELPYITPPSPPRVNNQQHFSGDSTESTKGYTSISVREPLSSIMAATKLKQQVYATVSDDSDEMYAAIEDASISGSDTYAQIQTENVQIQSVQAEINIVPNINHSRQESASSSNSLANNVGSPKPEKRQANSPLPPPPATPRATNASSGTSGTIPPTTSSPASTTTSSQSTLPASTVTQRISSTGDLHLNHDRNRRSLNEKHSRNHSCVSSSDFYGCNYPVDKHRFSSGDLIRPLVAKELNFDIDKPFDKGKDNIYNIIDSPYEVENEVAKDDKTAPVSLESPLKNLDDMYAKVMKKKNLQPLPNSNKLLDIDSTAPLDDPEYETIDRKASIHGYEKITKSKRNSQDPGYETVGEVKKPEGKTVNGISKRDSNYDSYSSESEPNYETLNEQGQNPTYAVIPADYKNDIPAYSVINKKQNKYWELNNDSNSEPNYESMPYTTGSESDPNYESVNPKLPDYESIRQDPNYESLRSKHSNYESLRNTDHGYENIAKEPIYKDPTYERVNEHCGIAEDDSKVYESIRRIPEKKVEADNVSDYFQV